MHQALTEDSAAVTLGIEIGKDQTTGMSVGEVDMEYVKYLADEKAKWEVGEERRGARRALVEFVRGLGDKLFDALKAATRDEERKIRDVAVVIPVVDPERLCEALKLDLDRYESMFSDKVPRELQAARVVWAQVRKFARWIGQSNPDKYPGFNPKRVYEVQAMVCRIANDQEFGYDLGKLAAADQSIVAQYKSLRDRLSFI